MKRAIPLALFVLTATVHAQEQADAARGEALFRTKCAACHSVACNRMGPKLDGLIGRPAGSVADFKLYTAELKSSKVVWSEQALDEYISDPTKMVPGTSMAAAGRVANAAERRDILAHIRRQDRSIDLCL